MINLFFLKTFVDAAKTGSVKTTALKKFVTQPAVTQHIHVIEEKLECQLFERRNKKIFLTDAGKILLPYAEGILRQYEEARTRLKEAGGQFSGTIRIATIYSIGLYQLQPIVRNYLKKFPKINIHLEYQPFDKIYEMVANHAVDFGFVSHPRPRHDIAAEVFDEEKLVLAQSPHHRVLKNKKMPLTGLDRVKFVGFSSEMPTRKAIDGFLKSKDVTPAVVAEYDNIETLKSAVGLGIGCSILPMNTLGRELKERTLEIVPVKGLNLTRPIGILYAKEKELMASAEAFYEMVMKYPQK